MDYRNKKIILSGFRISYKKSWLMSWFRLSYKNKNKPSTRVSPCCVPSRMVIATRTAVARCYHIASGKIILRTHSVRAVGPQAKRTENCTQHRRTVPPPWGSQGIKGPHDLGLKLCAYAQPFPDSNPNPNPHHHQTGAAACSAACFPNVLQFEGAWRSHPHPSLYRFFSKTKTFAHCAT